MKGKEFRYELAGISDEAGIRFLDTKKKLPYVLDEETGELIGMGEENWHKRLKVTKEMDIDTRIPFFKKVKEKLKGFDIYANIKGDRYAHDKEKNMFIGIDKAVKGQILHVQKQAKMPIFGMIPIIHYPLYVQRIKAKDYPYAFVGSTVVGTQFLMPLVEELEAVNPPLAWAIASSPIVAGVVAEKLIRNKKLQAEIGKDIHKFEDFVHGELEKIKTWEKAHFIKKLEKVI
jgi:hypothetical protein